MSDQGVPIGEATAKDFIMVRAALVKRLGGADQALVWGRIFYRCDEDSKHAIERDGHHWWKASHGLLAKETGLTEKQARVAVESLVAGGFLSRENFGGRVYAYRPMTYLPNRADTVSAAEGRSIRPDGQMHLPYTAVAPLIETEDIEKLLHAPAERASELFDAFYFAYPRKVGKEDARKAFGRAAKKVDPSVIVEGARRFAADPNLPQDKKFIPHPASWLNAGRWDDEPLPGDATAAGPGVPADDEFTRRRDEWLSARGVTYDEYLAKKDEPGWLEGLERRTS